jgi:hypothetical protein
VFGAVISDGGSEIWWLGLISRGAVRNFRNSQYLRMRSLRKVARRVRVAYFLCGAVTPLSAWSRSSIKSSVASSPTDDRINPSVIPRRRRSLAAILACEVPAIRVRSNAGNLLSRWLMTTGNMR